MPGFALAAALVASAAAAASAQEAATRSTEIGRPPTKDEEVVQGRFVFAGIGVDAYEHDEIWAPLDNAVADVVSVREMLAGTFDFYSPDELILTDEEATAANIRALVDRLLNLLEPNDNLVFFFAGHGISVPVEFDGEVVDNTPYIVPVGAKAHAHVSPSQYIEIEDLLERLARLRARHVLAIFDSCESGIALSEGGELKTRGGSSITVPADLQRRRSRHVITSAMENQKAFDDNERYPGNSLFTGWLLEGLRRASEGGSADEPSPDQNEDGALTVSEIAQFVTGRVSTVSEAQQTPDHGTFELDARGELVITLDTDPFDDLFRLAEELYLEFKIEQFTEVVDEALTFRSEGPRVSYLQYLQASLDGDSGAELRALEELTDFASAGEDIPMERGPLMVALRKANAACKRGNCSVEGGSQ
jgi:hypothetical protein